MTVQTMDNAQVRSFEQHLKLAVRLNPERIEAIVGLAKQLRGRPVLVLLGAGASHDCGMRLAGQIGSDLYADYQSDPRYEPRDLVGEDLSEVAEAIYNKTGQVGVVEALGIPEHELWPRAEGYEEHFCFFRVMARLAREDAFQEAIGFNYDCGGEAGLREEGFFDSATTAPGSQWRDHVSVITDRASFLALERPGSLTYIKGHGCAERFRQLAPEGAEAAAETIVIRRSQLTNWRNDSWMQDRLRDRARNHVLLLIGFSGQDPVLHGEIETILGEVYSEHSDPESPRLVVVDWEPNTSVLHGLIRSGLGGRDPEGDEVAAIDVSGASTTASTLVLLTETLALLLEPSLAEHGVELGEALGPRMAALTISAPAMLRWTYLLRSHSQNGFVQKINLEQAAEGGYVPLGADPDGVARSLAARRRLRELLGMNPEEGCTELLAEHSFIAHRGFAYLPVAISEGELLAACQPGGRCDRASSLLEFPDELECILVACASDELRGVNLATGAPMEVPQ